MLRRNKLYSICFGVGLCVLLIFAGNRYTDNTNYRLSSESRRNIRNFLKVNNGEDNMLLQPPTNPHDESPDIEGILEKTRLRIKSELWDYNFNYTGVHQLDDLLMEAGGRPMRSLIVSSWRSGSTFLGNVLNAMPSNFYQFEPLLSYEVIQIRGPPHAEKALRIIKNMLNCNYNDNIMENYFEYGKINLHQFSRYKRIWDHCKYKKELCFEANFTSRYCRLFPFQSMKVVRVRLRLIHEILEDKERANHRSNVKVVFLIRDPRGVMQSRQHCSFCKSGPDCWNPERLCTDMISDYVAAGRLLKQYPDRLMMVRFEELALNPNTTTHQLYKFLGLSVMPSVNEFLHTHTNKVVGGDYSTFRVSRVVPFKWKNVLDYDYVNKIQIQGACKEAMSLWGYRMAHNATHMASKEFYPLEQYSIKQ